MYFITPIMIGSSSYNNKTLVFIILYTRMCWREWCFFFGAKRGGGVVESNRYRRLRYFIFLFYIDVSLLLFSYIIYIIFTHDTTRTMYIYIYMWYYESIFFLLTSRPANCVRQRNNTRREKKDNKDFEPHHHHHRQHNTADNNNELEGGMTGTDALGSAAGELPEQ